MCKTAEMRRPGHAHVHTGLIGCIFPVSRTFHSTPSVMASHERHPLTLLTPRLSTHRFRLQPNAVTEQVASACRVVLSESPHVLGIILSVT